VDNTSHAAFQISKNAVTTSAVMKLGQTLILSGLTEKTREGDKTATPLLEEIPGLSFFFSRDTDNQYERSITILLTLRSANSVYNNGNEFVEEVSDHLPNKRLDQHFVLLLKKHYPDIFSETEIGAGLKDKRFSHQFRITDIDLKYWENPEALNQILNKIKHFI